MAEYRYGTLLRRGDVVVSGDGRIWTVIKNQDNRIWWAVGARDGARIIAHEKGDALTLEYVSHDVMQANMLVLASIE